MLLEQLVKILDGHLFASGFVDSVRQATRAKLHARYVQFGQQMSCGRCVIHKVLSVPIEHFDASVKQALVVVETFPNLQALGVQIGMMHVEHVSARQPNSALISNHDTICVSPVFSEQS
ncbi:hypothetical protein GZH46_00862 [Fragariocoptes setiger]|uniref:Uncharacterized protein n=1 Tax=Fragariocoptes setiger TaxID=1670756 RepID=A0ABQ7SB09_9ACAR|nr:hypothetical protein GZH46_00862 [Fragariocoptes setiger]